MRAFSIGTVAIVSALLLAGCGKEEKQESSQAEQSSTAAPATTNETATTPAPAATQEAAATPAAAGGKVNVYNWSDYVGEGVLDGRGHHRPRRRFRRLDHGGEGQVAGRRLQPADPPADAPAMVGLVEAAAGRAAHDGVAPRLVDEQSPDGLGRSRLHLQLA